MIRAFTDAATYAPPPLPPEAFQFNPHPLAPRVKFYHMFLAFCGFAAADASGHALQAFLAGVEPTDWFQHGLNWLLQGLLMTLFTWVFSRAKTQSYFYFQGGELVRSENGIFRRFGLNDLEKVSVYAAREEADTALRLRFGQLGRLNIARLENMPKFLSVLLDLAPRGVAVDRKRRVDVLSVRAQLLLFYSFWLLLVFLFNFATAGYAYLIILLLVLTIVIAFWLQQPRFRARE